MGESGFLRYRQTINDNPEKESKCEKEKTLANPLLDVDTYLARLRFIAGEVHLPFGM